MKLYQDKHGHRVQLHEQFCEIHFSAEGGGFVQRMTLDKFNATFTPVPDNEIVRPYRPATFSIDGGDEIPGFHNGQRWNGWACPCFEHESVLLMQKIWEGRDTNLVFDELTKAWILPSSLDEPEEWIPGTIIVDGVEKTVYHVGAGAWVWDVTEIEGEK